MSLSKLNYDFHRFGRLCSQQTRETIAYIDCIDWKGYLPFEMNEFMSQVYYATWQVTDAEVETYCHAFDSIPLIHISELSVISFVSWADHPESDKGPWTWNATVTPRKQRA